MSERIQGLLARLRAELEQVYAARLRGVYLYGSCARGEEDAESDVDVIIVLDRVDGYLGEGHEPRGSAAGTRERHGAPRWGLVARRQAAAACPAAPETSCGPSGAVGRFGRRPVPAGRPRGRDFESVSVAQWQQGQSSQPHLREPARWQPQAAVHDIEEMMMRHRPLRAASLIVTGPHASLALAALASVMLAGPLLADTPTTVLHAFALTDGGNPYGSLIAVGDNLYGMTYYGGTGSGGVIYRLNKNGSDFSVLHNFTSGAGYKAYGALVEVGGKLYGLTYGTTFSDMQSVLFNILPDGSGYHVLHPFHYPTQGGYAHGTPVHSGGFLYGFTGGGGPGSAGTVFRYEMADSSLDVLHAFSQSAPVGGLTPLGSPLVVDGVIYGMTVAGGSGAGGADGTLFRIGTDGSDFQVLHSFSRYEADNGAEPYGDVVAIGDSLYGMTRLGGSASTVGMGTIFRIHKTGSGFEILHRFLGPDYNPAGDDDGMEPYGSLTPHGPFLYGMTTYGGSLGALRGTVFRIRPDGSEYEVLHNFAGGVSDGREPYYAAPLCEGSTLYTSTRAGGSASNFGTVVSMELPVPVEVPETPAVLPRELSFALAGANPTTGSARFRFGLPVRARVDLTVHDVAGRRVARLVSEELEAGYHTVSWSSRDGGGRRPAGVYFARLTVSGRMFTQRVVVLQ